MSVNGVKRTKIASLEKVGHEQTEEQLNKPETQTNAQAEERAKEQLDRKRIL